MLSGREWASAARPYILALGLCLLLTGCGERGTEVSPAVTPSPEPSAAVSVPPVYTDWSKLEPYRAPEVKFTRRQEGFMDTLVPGDYGALIPFAGAALTREESWSGYYDTYNLYGLVTLEGEVAVDPVFSSAYALVERDMWGGIRSNPGVWMLGKVFFDPAPDGGEPEVWYALCAMDGSWCTDFLYSYDWEMMMTTSFEGGLPLPCRGGGVALVDPYSGKELRRVDCSAWLTDTAYWNGIYVDPESGYLSANLYDWEADVRTPLVFDPQGERVALPPEVTWVGQCGEGLAPAQVMEAGVSIWYGYVDVTTGQWAIEPVYRDGESFSHGVAPVSDGTNGSFIDRTGRALTGGYSTQFQKHGDYWYFLDENWSNVTAVFDPAGRPVDSPLVGMGSPSFDKEGWVSVQTETERLLVRGTESHSFPLELGWLNDLRGDRLLFTRDGIGGEPPVSVLMSLEGETLGRWERSYAYFDQDDLTGQSYVRLTSYQETKEGVTYCDLDGTYLFSAPSSASSYGDTLYQWGDGYTSLTDREGKLIFGWRYPLGED